jgi:hypothetical protein
LNDHNGDLINADSADFKGQDMKTPIGNGWYKTLIALAGKVESSDIRARFLRLVIKGWLSVFVISILLSASGVNLGTGDDAGGKAMGAGLIVIGCWVLGFLFSLYQFARYFIKTKSLGDSFSFLTVANIVGIVELVLAIVVATIVR